MSWRHIWLIADREIRARVRTRSFRVALGLTCAAIVLAIVLPDALDRPEDPYVVAIPTTISNPERDALVFAGAAVGRDVVFEDVVDVRSVRRAIRARDVDLAVLDDDGEPRLLVRRTPTEGDTSAFSRFLATAESVLRTYAGLYDSGLSPEEAQSALVHPPLRIEGVEPARDERTSQKAVTAMGVVIIFVFVQQYGFWLINGVIEEKSSRVIEVLLSVAHPSELLLGKTLGIGAVALLHGVVLAGTALAASAATGGSVLGDGGNALVPALLGWFFLAYVQYCLLMAMAGALVARQEDAQNATFPVLAPLILGYFVSSFAIWATDPPPLLTVLSLVPLSAPMAMPTRLAIGPVPAGEVVLAVVLSVVSMVVLARLAVAVYARGVLHTAGRLRWRDVLRRGTA